MFLDWDENKGSAGNAEFQFGIYDVSEAKRILKAAPRDSVELEVAGYAAMLKMITGTGSATTADYWKVPLIVVKVNAGYLPIDGWGRIAKAIDLGRPSLDVVILTKEEKQRIQRT
jgi:hypothetical protein